MWEWIISPPVMGFFGGVVSGALTWLAANIVGEPVKQFRKLRLDAIHALNRHQRYVVGSADEMTDEAIFEFAIHSTTEAREAAHADFRDIGLRMLALTSSERLATALVKSSMYDPRGAAFLILNLSQSLSGVEGGDPPPNRQQICDALKIRD